MRIILFLLILLWTAGCGSSSVEAPMAAPAPPSAAPRGTRATSGKLNVTASATVNNLPVVLRQGWSAVAFQSSQVTALNATSQVLGQAVYNGQSYVPGNFDLATLNAGSGARRGFWVFASAPTSFTYSGADDGQGNFVDLSVNGYQLVSFCSSTEIPTSSLQAQQNGQPVRLDQVVLPTFFEVASDGSYVPVEVLAGATLKPGRPYWVYANPSAGTIRLSFNPLTPTASPSPSLAPSSSPSASASPTPLASPSPGSATPVATSLVFNASPTVTAGTPATFTVRVLDQSGRLFTASPVTVSLGLNTSPAGATLSAGATTTVNGVASIPTTFTRTGANYTLRATAPGLNDGVSNPFTAGAGAAASLAFITDPTGGQPGSVLPNVQVGVADALGNLRSVTGSTMTVTLAISSASGGGALSGTVSRTIAVNANNVTFNDLQISQPGTYTLSATATGGPAVAATVSPALTMAAASGLKLVVTAPAFPQTLASGGSLPVSVQIQDASSVLQTSRTDTVTLTMASQPAVTPVRPTLAPGLTQLTAAASGGQASFNVAPNLAGAYTFQVSAAGFPTVTTGTLTVGAGQAATLIISTPPPGAMNATIANTTTVQILDEQGNLKTNATGPVLLHLDSGQGQIYTSAGLAGPLSLTPSSGAAAFSFRLPVAQPAARLRATYAGSDTVAGGVPDVVSNSFVVRGETLTNNGFIGAPGAALTPVTSASLSDDGRFQVYEDPTAGQLYRRDRQTGAIVLVSAQDGTAGVTANAPCYQPRLSDDGLTVSFQSEATNLIPGFTGTLSNIYVRRLDTNRTVLVSAASGSTTAGGNNASASPFLSRDGTRVGFQSRATNLGVVGNGQHQIFSITLTGTNPPAVSSTVLASVNTTTGANASTTCNLSGMSSDGLTLVYETDATNLGGPALAGSATGRVYRSGLTSAGAVSQVASVTLSAPTTASAFATVSDTGVVAWRALVNPSTGTTLGSPTLYTYQPTSGLYTAITAAAAITNWAVIDRTGDYVAYFNGSTQTRVVRLSNNTLRPALSSAGNTPARPSLTSGAAWVGFFQANAFTVEPGP